MKIETAIFPSDFFIEMEIKTEIETTLFRSNKIRESRLSDRKNRLVWYPLPSNRIRKNRIVWMGLKYYTSRLFETACEQTQNSTEARWKKNFKRRKNKNCLRPNRTKDKPSIRVELSSTTFASSRRSRLWTDKWENTMVKYQYLYNKQIWTWEVLLFGVYALVLFLQKPHVRSFW